MLHHGEYRTSGRESFFIAKTSKNPYEYGGFGIFGPFRIKQAIKRKQAVYYYDLAHAELIIQAMQEHPEFKDEIRFELEV